MPPNDTAFANPVIAGFHRRRCSTTGVQLTQWSTTGGANQQWYLRPNGDGYFTIISRENGLAADVNGWSTDDGAKVVQWTATGAANQQWQLIPAS